MISFRFLVSPFNVYNHVFARHNFYLFVSGDDMVIYHGGHRIMVLLGLAIHQQHVSYAWYITAADMLY